MLSLALSSGNAPARRKPCNKDTASVLSLPLSSKLSQKVRSDQTQTGSVTGIPPRSARKPYPLRFRTTTGCGAQPVVYYLLEVLAIHAGSVHLCGTNEYRDIPRGNEDPEKK